MSEYVENLNVNDYYYREPVYITETGGIDRTDYVVCLTLNRSTFNFSQARNDGKDFKLSESSNGSSVLYMWRATWSKERGVAVLWFKIPKLFANETKTLYAFWGNELSTDVSNKNDIDLLFCDDFCENYLDLSMWAYNDDGLGYKVNNYMITPQDSSHYMYTRGVSIGVNSWEVTMGCYFGSIGSADDEPLNAFYFSGSENTIHVRIYPEGTVGVEHTAVDATNYISYNDTERGMETSSYAILTFRYYEQNDKFYFGMSNRNTYGDYIFPIERKVEGDTRHNYITIVGKTGGTNSYNYIDWVASREFNNDDPTWDISSLYKEISGIDSMSIDTTTYGLDLTDETYYHFSSIGGTPENISDNATASINDVWYGQSDSGFSFVDGALYNETLSSSQDLDGYTLRQIIPATTMSGFSERIKLVLATTSKDWSFDSCYIGYSSTTGDIYCFDGDNTQVTFNSGDYGATLGDSDLESDEFVFNFDSSKDILVSFDISSSSENVPYNTETGYISYYKDTSSAGEAADIDVDGYTLKNNRLYAIKNIKIREAENILIDFGRSSDNLVERVLGHYDNNHEYYYNASKLSDTGSDIYGRTYWQTTTASGVWAAVDFGSTTKRAVGTLAVKALSSDLDGMVKNFRFEGTNTDPRTFGVEWATLYTGVFSRTSDWQAAHFVNGSSYQYYRLYVIDTYGNNAVLQEWGMYAYNSNFSKKVISQLRLRPITFSSGEYYFPRNILFYGSDDMINWTNLIPITEVYSPFMETGEFGRWHRYSFSNTTPYWCYKLEFTSNWSSGIDKIGISEWEMVETDLEGITNRVLVGVDNDVSNVSANAGFTFDDGILYASIDTVLTTVSEDKMSDYEVWDKEIRDINVV